MRHALFPALTLLLVSASTGFAQDDRYVLEKTIDGLVRMDRESGEMSLCVTQDGSLVCKLSADERTAYQDEIDRLQSSVRDLETRLGKLEGSAPARVGSELPSEEEFATTLNYMERFMRTFMGVVKEMDEKDADTVTPSVPNRT